MSPRSLQAWVVVGLAMLTPLAMALASDTDPFAPLAIYDGEWTVRAEHPWSGTAGATDRLTSRCHRFTAYFACEQTINDRPTSLIVYNSGAAPGRLNTRTIAPNGLAGGRGDLTLDGSHWTYIDKPPASLKGNWSRTENVVVDKDHIRFEEHESADEGKTWTRTNAGEETRLR